MKALKFIKKFIFVIVFIQILIFIIVKQKHAELERKNGKIEEEINKIINQNNILKIKLTTVQNQFRIRKLASRFASEYRGIKPEQIIEIEKI
jgi:hypothetical protein